MTGEARTCALESCDVSFIPKRATQIFCRREHGQTASNARRNYGVGSGEGKDLDLEREATAKQKIAGLETTLRHVVADRDQYREAFALATALEEYTARPPTWLTPKRPSRGHRATATLLLTDCHFDEVVSPEEIDGINAYNREIAEARLKRTFERTIRMSREYLAGVSYDGIVVMLGGDLVSGIIHEELRETNFDMLYGTVTHFLDPLLAGIDMLATEFGKVHLVGVPGNHSRSKPGKPRFKGRARDTADWLIYTLLARDLRSDSRITFEIPEAMDARVTIYDCVAPETRILTEDLRWVPAGDICAGMGLIGFDESLNSGLGRGRTRRWRSARVMATGIDLRDTVRLVLESGQELVCTPSHRWLCGTSYGFANQWVRADSIRPGWTLRRFFSPWTADESWEGGWLAGLFDGEGSLGRRFKRGTVVSPDGRAAIQPSLSQNEGVVAARLRKVFANRGMDVAEDRTRDCTKFTLRGYFADYAALFGSVRPTRMLEEFGDFVGSLSPHMNAVGGDRVVRVEPAGRREVVVMGTDTKTYVAEGFGSHNTRYLLTHGNQFHGGTGIAGALSPLMLGVARKGQRERAAGRPYDYMCMGHWHQRMWIPGKGLIVGGSLIGFSEFDYGSNFTPEPPTQEFWLTTPEHGPTISAPIFVADRSAEGW